ncbi:DUF5658 family protein [Rhodoferax antarcticus]|uniref:DUF5658 family protein n=1 Tax=Rhodoferax antarcticus TaxID=81479 RepID=UPI000AD58FA1|nr:DUF5658 family protein [Rhodoferax antarcticus]
MPQEMQKRRSSDKIDLSPNAIKRNRIYKMAVTSLCVLIIILQVLDAISTFMGINTGHLVERNVLLNKAAHVFNVPIQIVVLAAKMLVASMFAWLMIKTKPSMNAVASLFFVAAFYIAVVHRNFYWLSVMTSLKG